MILAIGQIYENNARSLSYEELYRAAYTLVLSKNGMRLYTALHDTILSKLHSCVDRLAAVMDSASFTKMFLDEWEQHVTVLRLICDIVMYMDHNFVRSHNKAPTRDMGMRLFQTEVLLSPRGVGGRYIDCLLDMIDDSRCPDTSLVDSSSVPKLVSILIETSLGRDSEDLYEQLFLGKFLDRAEKYYAAKAAAVSAVSPREFVDTALTAYNAELALVSRGFDCKYTYPKLVERLNRVWVDKYYEQMITTNLTAAFASTADPLEMAFVEKSYRLFSRTRTAHKFLIESFSKHVSSSVKSCAPLEVPTLITQRQAAFRMIKECFNQDPDILFQTRHSFETVFSDTGDQVSRILCKFLDDQIRKSSNQENYIDECIELFKLIQSKDVFEGYYKFYLGRRLLGGDTSYDLERLVISKLKAECGQAFTSKMEGMLMDAENSSELMREWKEDDEKSFSSINMMSVKILTTGLWPTVFVKKRVFGGGSSECVRFPGMDEFEKFYGRKFSGRKLTWVHSLGSMEMRARFSSGVYMLQLSAVQGMILDEIERLKKGVSFLEIPNFCGGDQREELKRHFVSLIVNSRCRLLVPSDGDMSVVPKSMGEFNPNQKWIIDDMFSSTSRTVKVPLIVSRETTGTPDQTEEPPDTGVGAWVEEDRKHLLEACIIRVMKGKKQLDHNNLMTEVVSGMSGRFVPSVEAIKDRIENLLEREFIKRDETDPRVYHYVA